MEKLIDEQYLKSLKSYIKKSTRDEWLLRLTKCSHHLVAAVSFRETSESSYQKLVVFYYPVQAFIMQFIIQELQFYTWNIKLQLKNLRG